MSQSYKEIYKELIKKGDFDPELLNKYKSLNDLKRLLNSLNQKRNLKTVESNPNIPVKCNAHIDFAVKDQEENRDLSLSRFKNTIQKVQNLKCTSDVTYTCTCQSLAGCQCDSRTLSCNQVTRYGSDQTYTIAYYQAVLGSTQVSVPVEACSCNSRYGGYFKGAVYTYYYCSSRVAYYRCSCNSVCACQWVYYGCYLVTGSQYYTSYYSAVYDSTTISTVAYYYYYYVDSSTYYTYYTYQTQYFVDYYTPVYSCSCNTRTASLGCLCNTRSESLCKSRVGCTCDSVCDCNTVKLFES